MEEKKDIKTFSKDAIYAAYQKVMKELKERVLAKRTKAVEDREKKVDEMEKQINEFSKRLEEVESNGNGEDCKI